jgi:hypothetical protein
VSAKLERQLARLEQGIHREAQEAHRDTHEMEKRLKDIREAAEQENERFYRYLAIERRTAFLESVGFEGHTAEDVRDENFLYAEDEPPFTITEDGEVFCTWDGKPVTDSHQTLAKTWYWKFHDEGDNPRGLVHDEETQGFYMPEPPHELAFSRDRCYLPRYFWALGSERAQPYCISVLERLERGGSKTTERPAAGAGRGHEGRVPPSPATPALRGEG